MSKYAYLYLVFDGAANTNATVFAIR